MEFSLTIFTYVNYIKEYLINVNINDTNEYYKHPSRAYKIRGEACFVKGMWEAERLERL